MKKTNLYKASQTLLEAKELVLDEHDFDKQEYLSGDFVTPLSASLLEHPNPKEELFPTKQNAKPKLSKLRGNSSIQDIIDAVDS
ncbi:MAG: hypothetical protein WAS27_01000 [Candidatus Saccharimonadales bacterium]